MLAGVLGDVNHDLRFDFVGYWVTKPDYISAAGGFSYLATGPIAKSPCVLGTSFDEGCAFTKVDPAFDITPQAQSQWGLPWAQQTQDMDGDGRNDLVFGTYASGGASDTVVYLMLGKGDGTFAGAKQMFTQPGGKGPANSFLFADFTNDKLGDVLMGFDDDGDAGSGWLYPGTGPGAFSQNGSKVIDLNPSCNDWCGDNMGFSGSARPFDFNFDGSMDVVVGYSYCENAPNCYMWAAGDSKIELYLGNGDGTFKAPVLVYKVLGNTEANSFAIPTRICPWYKL